MALVLDPDLVDAHSNLGNLLKAQGRLARQILHKCIFTALSANLSLKPDELLSVAS